MWRWAPVARFGGSGEMGNVEKGDQPVFSELESRSSNCSQRERSRA
jgi:hypothetical protein